MLKHRFAILLFIAACSKTPEEATALSLVQLNNGFARAGGVMVAPRHILTDLNFARGLQTVEVLSGDGRAMAGVVTRTAPEFRVALVRVDQAELEPANVGVSGDLLKGDTLTTRVFSEGGADELVTGRLAGWEYVEGIAFMEASLKTPKSAAGIGVFSDSGKLVGVQSFQLPPDRTFLVPIDYVTNGPNALTADLLGDRVDDRAFAATRTEASKHMEKLIRPIRYEELAQKHGFSRKAFVAGIRMLDSKQDPAHAKPLKFKLDAAVGSGTKTVAKGSIDGKNLRWALLKTEYDEMVATQEEAYGELFVEDNLKPNDYGELRYRIPFDSFCPMVANGKPHALIVTLADGRQTEQLVFSGLSETCAGTGANGGFDLEREWFSGAAPVTAAPPAAVKRAKMKSKKKRKARRFRKKRRRRRR
jgi:hypothetical protein